MRTKTNSQLSPPTSGSLSQSTVQTHKGIFYAKDYEVFDEFYIKFS